MWQTTSRLGWGCVVCLTLTTACWSTEELPNRVVVLTFDDCVKTHFTHVRPLLKKHGFGATFFVTEGFEFRDDKQAYMTWDEIGQLARDGFEVGNHTRDHMAVTKEHLVQLDEQLDAIEQACLRHGIPKPVSFGYPGNAFDLGALKILEEHGIRFARRGTEPERPYAAGQGFGYEPGLDHPLLIPTAGDARPAWTLNDFQQAARRGRGGRVAVLQFHGVPDEAHPWVSTPVENFRSFLKYLADEHYTVLALRDLARYVPEGSIPKDPEMVIRDRQTIPAGQYDRSNARRPDSDASLRTWLENMLVYHRFTEAEMVAATGLDEPELRAAIERFQLGDARAEMTTERLTVLPYPGGRHPRIGFRDGEIRPQRETKASVFLPWNSHGYVVLDIPEAIWFEPEGKRQLLYLAHTHIPTYWDEQNVDLDRLEWDRLPAGQLRFERRLPNGITFGSLIKPERESVSMQMWLHNGTRQTLRGLRVQNCVMLAWAPEFAEQTSDNKQFDPPYAVCRNRAGTRWVISAWQPCVRPWGNAPCPCLHSDPQFPDCPPGETSRLVGRLSFYEGTQIKEELARIRATGWDRRPEDEESRASTR